MTSDYGRRTVDECRAGEPKDNGKATEKGGDQDVEGGSNLDLIKGKFDRSAARLEHLAEHIASTDRLIDLIVYRLYGLTEEEVAIVEERM